MFLGLDASTQSISAVLIDTEKNVILAEDSVNFGTELPQYNAPSGFIQSNKDGEIHADPSMWLDALDLLLGRMHVNGVDFSKVKAVSGAGQQHATVYLNSKIHTALKKLDPTANLSSQLKNTFSRPTAPIWMDNSTSVECDEIAEQLGNEAVCATSGSLTTPRFSGPQIRKFSKENPEAYKATDLIHLNSSFFASIFAGTSAPIDTGDGAGMNLMNLATNSWDEKLLDATAPDLKAKLPPISLAGTKVSSISSYFVNKYNFATDCIALSWTGDNPASLVGMGAATPGQLVISLGTSDTLFAAMPKAKTDPNGYGHVFGNPMGGYMSLICFANGSLARERVKDDNNLSWEDFDVDSLNNTPPGNYGNVALPFFTSEITPRLQSDQLHTNGWSFVTADTSSQVRATIEGQFLNMKLHSDWMGIEPQEILLTGGASKNNGIAQTIANIFQAPVTRLNVASSVGLGAALRAAVSLGLDYQQLSNSFCRNSTSSLQPTCDSSVYKYPMEAIQSLLMEIKN